MGPEADLTAGIAVGANATRQPVCVCERVSECASERVSVCVYVCVCGERTLGCLCPAPCWPVLLQKEQKQKHQVCV